MSDSISSDRGAPAPAAAPDHDVLAVQRLPAVATALEVLHRVTGLRMAVVARVTPEAWTACAVLDLAGFGLRPGLGLDVATTYCRDVCAAGEPLFVLNAREDPRFRDHPGLLVHGIHTYIAVPLMYPDGEPFGALCALDPNPTPVSRDLLPLFELLARLIAHELDADRRQRETDQRLAAQVGAQRALRESEGRLRFLDDLGQATQAAQDPREVMELTTRMLGEYLGASRCAYASVGPDGDQFAISYDWRVDGAPTSMGGYRLRRFGTRARSELRSGRTLVLRDIDAELPSEDGGGTFAGIGVHALICCPRIRDGRLMAMMAVHQDRPRNWQPGEILLVQEVAQRSWAFIESLALNRALQEADQRKDEFIATLAHELRNPLAPIRSGLALLQRDGVDDAAAVKTHAIMDRQISHMVRLIDDLMDVSRIGRGKMDLKKERVDLHVVLDGALETSLPSIQANEHELSVHVPPGPLPLFGDPVRLSQVFSNILANASKYTPPGGRIAVNVERDGPRAVVRVTDTGIGLDPSVLPDVFDMFMQVSGAVDRAQGGLGIGLMLVKRLVDMHGGSVSAESDGHGTGTTFIVALPLAAPDEVPGEASASSQGPSPPSPAALRVLVVDDYEDGAEVLSIFITDEGHTVQIARTGEEALRMMPVFTPHVVILDIGLPGLTGYEVARRIREEFPESRAVLVALTGWATEHDKQLAAKAGFDHHLTKPVDLRVVHDLLAAAAGRL